MKIMYKCHCLPEEVEIDVPNRVQGCDVIDWMDTVTYCVSSDHRARNALCMTEKMEYVKIPLDNAAQGIGVPPTKQ